MIFEIWTYLEWVQVMIVITKKMLRMKIFVLWHEKLINLTSGNATIKEV